ncbi:type II toxin-antitoxin system PemK/MazF family toxin [Paenarthrobacter sp. NPDC057981]|uniref:type II toxin-antitoxin system PemK/MazF family toxin n=1 Tax=Paenarthrobacter sp. NPDC057981 TaxID=3346297 RepID=UPI0036DA7FB7
MAFDMRPLGKFLLRSLRVLGGSGSKVAAPSTGAKKPARPTAVGHSAVAYPGDFGGAVRPSYSPKPDGQPDPGEIVWGWVPYEEDHAQGKDRPVLLIGRDGKWLLGLMLTSKDHDNGRRADDYVDIGSGPWDRRGRPSEVNVRRIIRLDPSAVRREGAVLGKRQFQEVSRSLQAQQSRR